MTEIFSTTDKDGDRFRVITRIPSTLYVVTPQGDGAYLTAKDTQALHAALGTWLEENKRRLPESGAIQFPQGDIAIYSTEFKCWWLTGSAERYSAKDLLDEFGPDWEELVVKA